MENNHDISKLENLLIKKSCEIGHLKNELMEQSQTIHDLQNMITKLVYEKLQIKSDDKILRKLNEIYEKNLNRSIDHEGTLSFYPQIKNKQISFLDVEKQIQNSREFRLLQKSK